MARKLTSRSSCSLDLEGSDRNFARDISSCYDKYFNPSINKQRYDLETNAGGRSDGQRGDYVFPRFFRGA